MRAEIICVGNELLYGDVLNTNTKYLSQQLAMMGIDVLYQMVVGDDEPRLTKAIHDAGKRVDLVILSGGLGPTYDDMTKETLTKALGEEMVLDEASLEAIKAYFLRIGKDMKDSNIKQAYRPVNGSCLANHNGTAPGIHIQNNKVHYFCLPGPPGELQPMFSEEVRPKLMAMSDQTITSKIYALAGIGESTLAEQIGHIMDGSENPRIAPYAKAGTVNLRLTAITKRREEGEALIRGASDKLMPYIKDYIYSEEGLAIEEELVKALREKGMTIATAESCTGGMVSSRIVNVSGASAVFMNGLTAYSNEAKQQWLGVPETHFERYGAVSAEVAQAMAEGVRRVGKADVGIGITGIAGPTGGTPEKPVGTVCIAVASQRGCHVLRHQFSGNREKIRETSTQFALVQAFRYITKS